MIKIHVIHTGKVYVSPALPFKDSIKNPNPLQLTLLSLYGRRNPNLAAGLGVSD